MTNTDIFNQLALLIPIGVILLIVIACYYKDGDD